MKKIISVILAVFFIGAFAIYKYQTNTLKVHHSVLFEKNTNTINSAQSKNIEDLSNNIKFTNSGALTYLSIENSTENRITVNGKNNVGNLRSYILSWYNDGNQINAYSGNVKCVIPSVVDEKSLLSFTLTKSQSESFIKKYGANNIMISIDGLGIASKNDVVVAPKITVNGIPAYGFSIFNVGVTAGGSKRLDYGFVTSDGVLISASELNAYANQGKVVVISSGQKIDFDGADNGQDSCLV